MRINKLSHNINMYMYLQGKAVVPPLPPTLTQLIKKSYIVNPT